MATRTWSIATTVELKTGARLAVAWISASRGDFTAATRLLAAAVERSRRPPDDFGWDVLAVAAAVGTQSGSPEARALVRRAYARLSVARPARAHVPELAKKLWIEAYLSTGDDRTESTTRLQRLAVLAGDDEPTLSRLGCAAWLLDETELSNDHETWRVGPVLQGGFGASTTAPARRTGVLFCGLWEAGW
ncbi:hypothetical protein [Frankia tisae]|uniref:hypothetical protein n=1 Tax=Frankia tisae TaxID=2950104 RepID=UPI0021C13B2C|nr:hypothetical protein [Frankia tisae]